CHAVPVANGVLADRVRVAAALRSFPARRVGTGPAGQRRRSGLGRRRRRRRCAPVLRPPTGSLRGRLPGVRRPCPEGAGGSTEALRAPHRAPRRIVGRRRETGADRRQAAAKYALSGRSDGALAGTRAAQGSGRKASDLIRSSLFVWLTSPSSDPQDRLYGE